MRRVFAFGLLFGTLLFVGGCSKGSGVVPVSGRATLEGQPVTDMMVNFTPTGETQGSGALALLDSDGRFTLTDMRGEAGVLAGEYKVSFWPAVGGSKPNPDDPADVVGGTTRRRVSLPGIYLDANQSPLRATVPQGGGTAEVLLTKSGKGATAKVTPSAEGR